MVTHKQARPVQKNLDSEGFCDILYLDHCPKIAKKGIYPKFYKKDRALLPNWMYLYLIDITKRWTMKKIFSLAMGVGWVFSLSVAGPITTVPWNGHPGAATFTFDDGKSSQVQNLSFLSSMDGVSVTFFVCTDAMDFARDPSGHMNFAKNGHEIGNHTATHQDLKNVNDLSSEIAGAASKLRGKGLDVTALATPYCSQDDRVKNAINQDHFINRSCGGTGLFSWGSQPNWMEMSSKIWDNNASVDGFKSSLSQAANNQWLVQLFHGINENDTYAISSDNIRAIVNDAVSKNLWVASFSTVGAYLRAHFTIDQATSTATADGFKVTWTSPHAHMPKSVPLRVNIEGAAGKTVTQKGVVVPQNSDGTYTIEFMTLELEVGASGTAPTSSSATQPTSSNSSTTVSVEFKIEMEDYDQGGQGLTYNDLDGKNDNTGYRTDDAGVVPAGSGYGIGYTMAGEWFNYSLDVTCQGQYSVVARAATGNASASRFSVSVENASGSVAVDVPSTQDDWNAYSEVEGSGTLNLSSGKNVIKVNFDESYINVDWIKLTSDNAQCPEAIPVAKDIRWNSFDGPVQYQVFDMNGHLLKSATVSAQGGVQALWQGVSAELPKGMYVLRYGKGSSMRSVQVRK